MIWKPNVTVAAVIKQEGKYLLVEEAQFTGTDSVYNQPAGHLEPGESIVQGAIRETLEETGYTFVPQFLVGIYHWYCCGKDTTYLRFAFSGYTTDYDPNRSLDDGIIQAVWYSADQIQKLVHRHRSPLVLQCIQDDLAGKRYPLELLTHCEK